MNLVFSIISPAIVFLIERITQCHLTVVARFSNRPLNRFHVLLDLAKVVSKVFLNPPERRRFDPPGAIKTQFL